VIVRSAAEMLSDEYVDYLRDIRGFAVSSLTHHRRASRGFLEHLEAQHISIASVQPKHVEGYVSQAGKRMCRGSLQHEIASLRGLLRFLATDGRAKPGLDKQIDTPRLYRLEQLPRSLPWATVVELLRSIDITSAIGLRDYAIFILIAAYGLRASEVVALTLDDVRWRKGVLRIHQRKTGTPLDSR
jgi:integrase/recombinase XerD